MPRFSARFSSFGPASLTLVVTVLAGCASTPMPPPQPQRMPSAAPSATTMPQGGVSRAQLEAAGNACEKVVASAVKTRYPQPGSVMMMPDRERIAQQTSNQTSVMGEGVFEPDASEQAMAFRYTCLYNIRTNRVDDVQMKYGSF